MTTSAVSSLESPAAVLVCAPSREHGAPTVVLADGSYETADERVFWRNEREAEVLRLPLEAPVSVRFLRQFPAQREAPEDERLAPATAPEDAHDVLVRRLTDALVTEDLSAAEAVAGLVWRHEGLAAVHRAVARCLAQAGSMWAQGGGSVLHERQVSTAARTLFERMRATSLAPTTGRPVVLAVPEGDRHTLALTALAHQLQESGRAALVVEDLPIEELCLLLRARNAAALVLSVHVPLTPTAVRRLVSAVREASPDTLVAVGGPGVPRGVRGPDLVTHDLAEVLAQLDGRAQVLSRREQQVLQGVADGLTNSEIAGALGLSPATVKSHLDRVFAKTGTEQRAAAVACALRKGWIT